MPNLNSLKNVTVVRTTEQPAQKKYRKVQEKDKLLFDFLGLKYWQYYIVIMHFGIYKFYILIGLLIIGSERYNIWYKFELFLKWTCLTRRRY